MCTVTRKAGAELRRRRRWSSTGVRLPVRQIAGEVFDDIARIVFGAVDER